MRLKDALGDLPALKSGQSKDYYEKPADSEFLRFVRKNGRAVLSEHRSPQNGEHLIRIMEALKEGQSKDDLPEGIRPKSGYGNTYAKLWWDKPSTTITRNFACRPLPGVSIQGIQGRCPSAREPACRAFRMTINSMDPIA